MIHKTCLACNTKIIKGRSDRKFCSESCRATYNYNLRKVKNNGITIHQEILKKNNKILKQLVPNGHGTIRKKLASELGYNFNYFTHFYKTNKGIYYFCYDFGFQPITKGSAEKMLVVQWQNYMERQQFDPWSRVVK
ncbi:DUF2116 family Zn-ribbon domain-containing protein [Flammeovirga pectinis]|uniref:DUF2116 family Zn-ribbon domain-containing protein n=1 Tax=Flammeovirga pectinis TaxID=2494373 RepID=A0A3S9PBA2_9BACT|nr:DUF2116 family Zn-ribbon domain-containing protein [Flammeovirga pectinis]AZQ65393.1 DUF2116 family Zn-ribbon domain-containing protein [Flammeovirga pectinis]